MAIYPLDCDVCFKPFSAARSVPDKRPFVICANGHSFCGDCASKVNNCPICRQPAFKKAIANIGFTKVIEWFDEGTKEANKRHREREAEKAKFKEEKAKFEEEKAAFEAEKAKFAAERARFGLEKAEIVNRMTKFMTEIAKIDAEKAENKGQESSGICGLFSKFKDFFNEKIREWDL